jgi:hypothetical protein
LGGGIDDTLEAWHRLRDRVVELGRSVDDFGANWVVLPDIGVDDLTEKVEAWRVAGGTHASIVSMGLDLDTADAHVDHLASVAHVLGLT